MKRKKRKVDKELALQPIIEKLKKLPLFNLNELAISNIASYLYGEWKTDETDIHPEEVGSFCFYRAFARQLLGDPEKYIEVKNKALDYLKKKKHLDNYNSRLPKEMDIKSYHDFHSEDQYADELMIEITSRAYKVPIYLFNYGVSGECVRIDFEPPEKKTIKEKIEKFFGQPLEDYSGPIIGLLNKGWLHFDSITNIKKKSFKQTYNLKKK